MARRLGAGGSDTTKDDWEEKLALGMFALNAMAVAQRYNEPAATGFIYRCVLPQPNRYQLLKSIDCWLYQCSEGDVPESKLYQFFDDVLRVRLLEHIVSGLPEYEKAAWE